MQSSPQPSSTNPSLPATHFFPPGEQQSKSKSQSHPSPRILTLLGGQTKKTGRHDTRNASNSSPSHQALPPIPSPPALPPPLHQGLAKAQSSVLPHLNLAPGHTCEHWREKKEGQNRQTGRMLHVAADQKKVQATRYTCLALPLFPTLPHLTLPHLAPAPLPLVSSLSRRRGTYLPTLRSPALPSPVRSCPRPWSSVLTSPQPVPRDTWAFPTAPAPAAPYVTASRELPTPSSGSPPLRRARVADDYLNISLNCRIGRPSHPVSSSGPSL